MKKIKTPEIKKPEVKTVSKQTFLQRILKINYFLIPIILAFAVLAFSVRNHPYFPVDLAVTKDIQLINFLPFTYLMQLLTFLGNYYPTIVSLTTAVLIFLIYKKWPEAIMILLSTLGIISLSETIKSFVHRPRPDPTLINQIGHFVKPDSFPSGHVLYYMGFYGFLLFLTYAKLRKGSLRKFLLILFPAMILLISPSRIFLGAHWFSDVLGSYLLGTVWLSLMIYLYKRIKT